jgi:hypothetical protein
MQKQAMALGYLFLAVFCVYVSAHSYLQFRMLLLWSALAAALTGVAYLISACVAAFPATSDCKAWFSDLFEQAQTPPDRSSKLADKNTA